MAASAGSTNASKSALEQLGLVGNHAYSVLKVLEVKDRMDDKICLIQLRNPWGCDLEWKGDWSDEDNNWTPELKKICGWSDADDGTFFMCLEDMKTYFSRVQICRNNDAYKYSYLKASHKVGSFSMIRFVVQAPGGHHYLQIA